MPRIGHPSSNRKLPKRMVSALRNSWPIKRIKSRFRTFVFRKIHRGLAAPPSNAADGGFPQHRQDRHLVIRWRFHEGTRSRDAQASRNDGPTDNTKTENPRIKPCPGPPSATIGWVSNRGSLARSGTTSVLPTIIVWVQKLLFFGTSDQARLPTTDLLPRVSPQ